MLARKQREKQYFDENIMYVENDQIKNCYEHFKLRYAERKNAFISYQEYWNQWIVYLKGVFLKYDKKGRMIRVIGNYLNEDDFVWVVYSKIKYLNIYSPITLYIVTDKSKKSKIYKQLIKNKKNIF